MGKPELVLPAGDLEKLYTALAFGADAVYAGGKQYSLRAYAGNLSLEEIAAGLEHVRKLGKHLYITVNLFAHNEDLAQLPAYLEALQTLGVDGLIVADPGVLRLARRYAPSLPITISTQANVTNYEAAAFYRDLGAKRIVISRELSLAEIKAIKSRVDIEIEMFVHGAMCMSYSGRCLLSHYMTGRSANRGECAHPCRYNYALLEEKRPGEYFAIHEDERGSYIMNSRDLCLLEYLPQLLEVQVDAFKIEGRMKSPLYVAQAARVYREALEQYAVHPGTWDSGQLQEWMKSLKATAARPFTNGFIEGSASSLQDIEKESPEIRAEFCGVVRGYDKSCGWLEIEQRANFGPGDPLALLTPDRGPVSIDLRELLDEEGSLLDRARHARQRVFIPFDHEVPVYSVLFRQGGGTNR